MQLTKHVQQGRLLYFTKDEDAISVSENDHYRWMAFGDVIQSVMLKRVPWKLTLPHQHIVLFPLLFFRPKNIIELGLGGGNIGRYLTHLHDGISFTSIECSADVIQCFHQHFNPDNTRINVIKNRAENWLEQQHDVDWLMCDVYQQQLVDFKHTLHLLESLMSSVSSETALTINLPDASDQEVNLCLTVLQQLQSHHTVVYFHVPQYLNIIIHVLPAHWQFERLLKRSKSSYLPKSVFKRWRKCWQYKSQLS